MHDPDKHFTKKHKNHPIFKVFYAYIIKDTSIKSEEDKLLCDIRSALKEWKNAENVFEFVTSPDLIDHSIYRIEAAKLKYTHLIKLAKEKNLRGIL